MEKRFRELFKGKTARIAGIALAVMLIASFAGIGIQLGETPNAYQQATTIGQGQQSVTIGMGQTAYAAGTPDYTCDGVADDVQYQAALNALPAVGGKLSILAGNYVFAATVSRAIDNVTIVGVGQASYIARDGVNPCFDAGAQSDWVFRDIRFDAGGVDVSGASNWTKQNVYEGAVYVGLTGDNCIIDNAVAKGTWTTSGVWTLPAFSAGGDIKTDRWLLRDSNTFFGVDVVGNGNLAHGAGAEGYYNSAFGNRSLYANTTGYNNSAFGYRSLRANTEGIGNTGLGFQTGASITTGDYNLCIGHGVDVAVATANYQVNIGTLIQGQLPYVDNYYATIMARDSGVGAVEVARAAGAADPWFAMGGAQEIRVYESGATNVNTYWGYQEIAAPGAGAANTARIYAVEDGGNLTDLCAVFQDGTVDIFAQETTPLDSPIFTQASGATVTTQMRKPHPGLIQFGYVFPNKEFFVDREIEYHDADKIAANVGCISSILPYGWEVTTLQQRVDANVSKISSKIQAAQQSLADTDARIAVEEIALAEVNSKVAALEAIADTSEKGIRELEDARALIASLETSISNSMEESNELTSRITKLQNARDIELARLSAIVK